MKLLLQLMVLASLISCLQKEGKENPRVLKPQVNVIAALNYDSCKIAVRINKQKRKPEWCNLSKKEKEEIFATTVTGTIIPGWIGTSWSFNGTSEKPQQGSIACGYFVTTVLRDAGLNLARIKLAQCPSEQMITSLIQPKYIQRFSNIPMDDFIQSIQRQGYGLYIVGLDNHTGFIYNDGKEICFIHSTFVGARNVQKEKAATSRVLQQSKYKVLGKISSDERLLERWMD